MKRCELCDNPARTFCDSDQANLCWDCDRSVHGVNFLVAKHSRTLLCQSCQNPTPWTASGPKLGPGTVSVCLDCVERCAPAESRDESVSIEEGEGDSEDVASYDDDDDEDEENQVVPWSSSSSLSPPPVSRSSSSIDGQPSMSGTPRKRVLASSSSSCPYGPSKRQRRSETAVQLQEQDY